MPTQPTWTPDGERIIFTHIAPTPMRGRWLAQRPPFIDADGTDMEVVDGRPPTRGSARCRETGDLTYGVGRSLGCSPVPRP